MSTKVNYLRFPSRRFDFGVPLEDIFPPNDIHPRLKYLFEEAYKFYRCNNIDIERIVRLLQGSLKMRLKLKQTIIHDIHYDIKVGEIEQAPGAYFWLIRHFLGLLPIPLLPTYSQGIYFDWTDLSQSCKNFLRQYESQHKKDKLDCHIAENLNLLPFEHFLLLTILVHFIRKLSKKAEYVKRINRRTLLFLCKYYCASIFIRPYTPGHKDEKMFPLFFYLVLRWREIEKRCRVMGHPAYYLESNYLNYDSTNFHVKDSSAQTCNFSSSVIKVYKAIPYFTNNNNYLKDTSCQTDRNESTDKAIQYLENILENVETSPELKQEKSEQVVCSLYPSLPKSAPAPINDEKLYTDEYVVDNASFSFVSVEDGSSKIGWTDIVKETSDTVKKLEGYIYDDYDTFHKEEYNQISDSNKSSIIRKLSKIGWSYTPPKNSARQDTEEILNEDNELENSYQKFEDVFDANGKYKTNGHNDNNEFPVKKNTLSTVFKQCNDSRIPLCKNNYSIETENNTEQMEGRSKKNFNLKRFKLKLDFLRVLAPKKSTYSAPSYESVESKVKYKKIKNMKSNTL